MNDEEQEEDVENERKGSRKTRKRENVEKFREIARKNRLFRRARIYVHLHDALFYERQILRHLWDAL